VAACYDVPKDMHSLEIVDIDNLVINFTFVDLDDKFKPIPTFFRWF